jgi:hypothetical protein
VERDLLRRPVHAHARVIEDPVDAASFASMSERNERPARKLRFTCVHAALDLALALGAARHARQITKP